jgi:orotate phosphoribosyltransferase
MTMRAGPMFPNLHASAPSSGPVGLSYSNAVVTETRDSILDLFERTGGYLRGHFLLTSGLHSPEYLQCAVVLQYPEHAARLGAALASALRPLIEGQVDVVGSPALGGIVIGHEVARALGARSIFTERDASGLMTLRRGFQVRSGERAVVIEDVVTTGGSTREVIEVLRAAGALVVAAGSIIDRSGGMADVGVPRVALATLEVVTYPPQDCPLCRQGVPLVKPGSRR